MDAGVEDLIKATQNYDVEIQIKNGSEKKKRFFQEYPLYAKFLDQFKNRSKKEFQLVKEMFNCFFAQQSSNDAEENPMAWAISMKNLDLVKGKEMKAMMPKTAQ